MSGVWIGGGHGCCGRVSRVRVGCRGRRLVFRSGRCAVTVPARTAGRAQPTLGIEEEDARGDYLLARLETARHFDAICQLHAEGHGARLESISGRDKHVLLDAGIHHRITRHGDDR